MRDKDPVIWLFKRSLSVRCDVRRGATSEEVQRSHPPPASSPKRCRGATTTRFTSRSQTRGPLRQDPVRLSLLCVARQARTDELIARADRYACIATQ